MQQPTPTAPELPARVTVERFFALVNEGVLAEDDRVELLEGVVVGMAPRNASHDAAIYRASEALRAVIGGQAVIRVQSTLVLGRYSVPEPDVAVVPGPFTAYDHAHPTTALLVAEVADSSLQQDRLTKAGMYAAAGIPEYLILNVRDDQVEVFRAPDPASRAYRERQVAHRGERFALASFPGAALAVDDLLPGR